jgi:hypothetical protein
MCGTFCRKSLEVKLLVKALIAPEVLSLKRVRLVTVSLREA